VIIDVSNSSTDYSGSIDIQAISLSFNAAGGFILLETFSDAR
jgi:hypothetical protein